MAKTTETSGTGGTPEPTTTALLEQARAGDREAVEGLFARYLSRVRRIVALRMGWRLRDIHDVDDLVQDALLRVFQSMGSLRAMSGGEFRNFVSRCVQNEVVDVLRRSKAIKRGGRLRRQVAMEDVSLASLIDRRIRSPGSEARVREREERVEAALLALPERHREVIVLRHLLGLEYAEIARTLGFAEEVNARMAVSRAMKKLREIVRKDGGSS
jgi:RNA polymerase sigma-70 factor (ECF subfamily)